MQRMARHPAEHNLVRCFMFGTCQGELAAGCSPCVQDDVISNEQGTNPWALQAVRDLLLLESLDEGATLLSLAKPKLLQLFKDPDLIADFCALDVTQLRAK